MELDISYDLQNIASQNDINITFHHNMPNIYIDQCLELCRLNMEEIYNKNKFNQNGYLGWDSITKKNEFLMPGGFTLILQKKEQKDDFSILGFCQFRFEIEEKESVVYLYELQLACQIQQLGL